jgi:hypothetical protein
VAFAAGLFWMIVAWRRRSRMNVETGVAPLTDAEQKALEKVIAGR